MVHHRRVSCKPLTWPQLCLLGLLISVSPLIRADDLTRIVRVSSTPPGAWICFKQRGAFQCSSQTPSVVKADFYDKNEVKTLYVKKAGYRLFSQSISPETTLVKATLQRSSELYKQLENVASTSTPGKVKHAFNKYLYEDNRPLIKNAYVDIVGPLQVVDIAGNAYLHVSLLAGKTFSDKELKKLYRLRNREEFKSELASTFVNRVLGGLVTAVYQVNERYSVGLKGISISISYPKNKAQLVDDEYQMVRTETYTWETQTERFTSIHIWTENVAETKVVDRKSYATLLLSLPLKKAIASNMTLESLRKHEGVSIMTNDNRQNKLEAIVP